METFRFVNAAGHTLPIYNGKPANDLLNEEIQELLSKLKQSEYTDNTFARSIYVLPLLREAMYRSTRQFPYPNQMLSLINSLMYQKNGFNRVLEKIDTGQGKSLIDAMKASVLFLQSPGVDITTSSLVDAKRDCEIYSSYFKLLGIPFLSRPLSSISPFEDFQDPKEEKKRSVDEQKIKSNLRAFFEDLKRRGSSPPQKDYLASLNTLAQDPVTVKKIHHAFVRDYIQKETQKVTQSLNSWLICHSHLYTLSSDLNYLLLIHAIAGDMKPEEAIVIVKPAIKALFEEYLNNSWWYIASNRRHQVNQIIEMVNGDVTMEVLMKNLQTFKSRWTREDIEENKTSFWRMFKPLHLTGNSRFQNCLDNSIALLRVFGQQFPTPQDHPPDEAVETIDDLKKNPHDFFKEVDSKNAAVMSKSLTKKLLLDSHLCKSV